MKFSSALRACVFGALLAPTLASPASATTKDKYTSTSVCNAANTKWTVTSTCTKTIGTASTKRLQSGIEYSPVSAGPPVVTVTDEYGNPILVGGVVLTMEASPPDQAEAEATYGTLSGDHAWAGFRSNVDIQDPDPAGFRTYVFTYAWPVQVGPQGAAWCSSTLDESGDGSTVEDSFILIPDAVPTQPRSWGEVKLTYRP